MKKSISLVTIFFSLFLITSCSGLFSNKSYEEAGKYIISGSVETEELGAIPEELLKQTDNSRSAVPGVKAGTLNYTVSAYLKSDATKTVKATSTSTDGTFSLKLNKAGVYILDCSVRYTSDPYFAGTKELELTEDESYKTGVVINAGVTSEVIQTLFASGATGDINLTFTADSDTGAATLKTYIDGTAQADITGTTSGSLTTFVLNVTGFTIGRKSHILKIEFYDAAGSLIYSCSDSLTVCKDLETNTWAEYNTKNPSPFLTYNNSSKKYEFLLTKTLTDGFKTTVFYVDGDIGSDSYSGLFDKPFATVQKAVEAVKEVNDGESEYTIYLLSDVTSSASSDFSSDYNSAFVDIGTSKSLKLIITSYGSDDTGNPNCFKIDAGRTYDTNNTTGTQGRVISVGGQYLQNGTGSALSSKSIQLTLDSVEITGGRIEGEGAGIIVANNGTLIINNAIIKNNKCFGTSAQGGGVYLKGFSGSSDSNKLPVMIINSGKITENTTEKDGSGISVYYGASLTMNGGEICNNTTIPSESDDVTEVTGALLINSGNVIINGGSISNNNCDWSDTEADIYGVGLSVRDSATLSASCNITGNKSFVEICNNYIIDESDEKNVYGVGLYLSSEVTGNSFYLNNLLVSGNIGTGDRCYGAGVYSKAELAMENVTISANKNALTGTGLYADKNVSANKNVQIINNIYDLNSGLVDGCGLYIASGSNFNFYDGIIAGNKCTGAGVTVKGEGVQVDGTFTMYDFAKVDESNDVYLPSGKTITIGSIIKNYEIVANITLESQSSGTQVLSGDSALIRSNYSKFGLTDSTYVIGNEGKVKSYPVIMTSDGVTMNYDPDTSTITVDKAITESACSSLKTYIETLPEGSVIVDLSDSSTMLSLEDCKSIKKVILPTGITELPSVCFKSCTNLLEVDFANCADSITTIGDSAFHSAKSITVVDLTVLPNLTSIGSGCFMYLDNITTIKIPASVTSLPSHFITDSGKIKDVYIYGTPTIDHCSVSTHLTNNTFNKGTFTSCEFNTGDPDLAIHVPVGSESFYTNESNGWTTWNCLLVYDL